VNWAVQPKELLKGPRASEDRSGVGENRGGADERRDRRQVRAEIEDARGRFIRTPREPEASCALAEEVDRQPPDHANDGHPTSQPARTDEAVAELFDEFLVFALAESDLWDVIAPALPEELFDRIDRHIEALLAEPGEQGR
jgi:hypothetical protein